MLSVMVPILKAMYRKVCRETGANTKEQVESVLTQCCQVKNDTARLGGFSPSQWVLGRAPRTLPSFASEEEHASLGAIAARHDPSSIFALQHHARLEAQKHMCIWTAHVGFRKHCSETPSLSIENFR